MNNYNRCCGMCSLHKQQKGGGFRFLLGLRQWVCEGCKKTIDKAKAK